MSENIPEKHRRVSLEAFSDFAHLDRFVAEDPRHLLALREFAASPFNVFGEEAQQAFVSDWLAHRDAEEARAFALEGRDIERRNVAAAEKSAAAAEQSAKSSDQSARSAGFAAVVAFFALVVSIAALYQKP